MKSKFVCILCWFWWLGIGQSPDLVFHHLNEEMGLSNNIVNCIYKDRNGFIWIGTYSGLNRYDGAHFTTFKNNNDPHSLPNNTVHCLVEDRDGNLWGGTELGIFKYSSVTNQFTSYKKTGGLPLSYDGAIACDAENAIWASAGIGLIHYNNSGDSFELANRSRSSAISDIRIQKNGLLTTDQGKNLWIATRSGLNLFDLKMKEFYNAGNDQSPIFFNHMVSALAHGKENDVWFSDGDNSRLIKTNSLHKNFLDSIDYKKYTPGEEVATIYELIDGNMTFSTWSNHVYAINSKHNIFFPIQHDERNPNSISSSFFWTYYQDENYSTWIGTLAGVSYINYLYSFFQTFDLSDRVKELDNDFAIKCFMEDTMDRSWWMGVQHAKLIHYFPPKDSIHVYDLKEARKNSAFGKPGEVWEIHRYGQDIYVCTFNGTWIVDQQKGSIRPYGIQNSLLADFPVVSMVRQNDSIDWYSDRSRLIQFNINRNQATEYTYDSVSLPEPLRPRVYFMTIADDQKLWVVTAHGVISYADERRHRLVPVTLKVKSAHDIWLNDFIADTVGNLWIAGQNFGLIRYNIYSGETKIWYERDGLGFAQIMSVRQDPAGRIWGAAYNKLMVYDQRNDRFNNFTLPFGVHNLSYNNSMITLANGDILTNMGSTLIQFYPDKINKEQNTIAPLIGAVNTPSSKQLISDQKEISFAPSIDNISILYGLPSGILNVAGQIQYKLEPLQSEWNESNNGFEANYSNLSPGSYTFKVRARKNIDEWLDKEASLKIYIQTPFYKASWFIAFCLLGLTTGVYSLLRWRWMSIQKVRDLQLATQHLEKEKAKVMYENLKQHLNPHFLFNSLTSLNSLIRLDQLQAGDFLEKMSKVYRYILKNRENETVPLSDELKFVQLYIDLQKTRFEKGLEVNMDIPEDCIYRKIAPVTLQNLIENAIKHNTADEMDPLKIDIYIEDDYLIVRNNLQKKKFVETSNKQGLDHMISLYKYLSNQPMHIIEEQYFFIVKIPLI